MTWRCKTISADSAHERDLGADPGTGGNDNSQCYAWLYVAGYVCFPVGHTYDDVHNWPKV